MRVLARWSRAVAVVAAAALAGACSEGSDSRPADGGAGAPPPTGFSGRFRAETPNGSAVMTLSESDGVVSMRSASGDTTARVVAEGRAEGTSEGIPFVLLLEGERLRMRLTVEGSAEPVEVVFERAPTPAAGGARDAALVGHWRHTETHASGGFGYAQDVHLVLADDGSYASWSKSVSAAGTNESARTTGVWKTDDGRLYLRADDDADWWEKGAYSVSDDGLLLRYGPRDVQAFERL
jgi:hypothetical protein